MPQSFSLDQLRQRSERSLVPSKHDSKHTALGWIFYASVGIVAGLTSVLLPDARVFARPGIYSSPIAPMKQSLPAKDSLEAKLAPAVRKRFKELGVPGAIIGVWAKGYQPWSTTLGVSDLAKGTPIQRTDKMRIGSITKTFTGTVFLQLVDEGKVSLDDPVSQYLPEVPNGKNIKIRELGNMTSGLFDYSEDETFTAQMSKRSDRFWTPQELVAIAFEHPLNFAPRQQWQYCNTNAVLLGMIVEKITGNSLKDEIQTRITSPLGMQQTFLATDGKMPEPHSQGYMYGTFANPVASKGAVPKDVTNENPSWGWAAGAMVSTLDDLHRYAKPLATGQLVSEKTQKERLMWVDVDTKGATWKSLKYGFLIADFEGAIGHNGGLPGFQSFMVYIPEQDATIIVLTNLTNTPDGVEPADALMQVILTQLQKK